MREYRLHDLDWRQLRSKLGDWFDVCLVVGNSLCLLSAPEALTQSIAQFYRVLKPGGMIVIDERNFRRIQRQAASGDQTPVRRFTHTGNVMYCGVRVQAFPRAVSGTEVYMGYYDMARVRRELYEREYWTDADWVSFEEAQIGSLHLYPFPGDGLGGLLDRAGFRDITVYNDLDYNEPVPWTDPLQLSASEAEFFTYTARKPHDAAPD